MCIAGVVTSTLFASWATVRFLHEVPGLFQTDGAEAPRCTVQIDGVRAGGRVGGFEASEFSTGVVAFAA